LHYCLHFTNGRSSYCIIFFFLAQESCICFHFSVGTSFCCMPFNLLNNSASASILYGQIFLLHPFQSAQESCIIVSISRSVLVSIASILSGQIDLLIALPSICSRILHYCSNFSIARSSRLHKLQLCSRILHYCFNRKIFFGFCFFYSFFSTL
jgi:hypothetical protein